ncbi:MAG: hypothetical protein ACR2IS_13610 [Nitrososphaeraceae archaeon]
MSEIPKFNNLEEIYFSHIRPTSAGYFFGDVTPEVVSIFGPYAIALDGSTKT